MVRERGFQLEYLLYPQCIQWIAQNDLQVVGAEDGRPQIRILDPEYEQFLEQLTRQAFAR